MTRSRLVLASATALALALTLALSSCGDDGAPPPVDGGPDGGPDAGPIDAGPIVCTSTGVERFPRFERSCSTSADCVAIPLQTDCCGSIRVTGVAATEETAFEEAAELCRAMYPDCECGAMPTSADDGTTGSTPDMAVADCDTGVCRTTFP